MIVTDFSQVDWQKISEGFEDCWNLPNCVGALDGKHVGIRAPDNSGSAYFNYKKCFSIVVFYTSMLLGVGLKAMEES